jgi:hypothetical protein
MKLIENEREWIVRRVRVRSRGAKRNTLIIIQYIVRSKVLAPPLLIIIIIG